MKKVSYLIFLIYLSMFLSACSVQKTLAPEHYDYIQAKNQLTTDLALISQIEHYTIIRLQKNQISVARAKNIDKSIKEINFDLDLAKKLLEAGNYQQSYKISKDNYKKLQLLFKEVLKTE